MLTALLLLPFAALIFTLGAMFGGCIVVAHLAVRGAVGLCEITGGITR